MSTSSRRAVLRLGAQAIGAAGITTVLAAPAALATPTPAAGGAGATDSASASASAGDVATVTDARWGGPDPSGDWTATVARIQAAASGKVALTIRFPPGAYKLNGGITHGSGAPLRLVGSGIGYVGGSHGTRLYRDVDGSPVIDARGAALGSDDPYDPPARTRLEVYDLEVDGGNLTGDVVNVFRGQQVILERVRISHAHGVGLRLTQAFNSICDKLYIGYCGSGETAPALLVDGTAEGSAAGSNTVHLSNVELEANRGTDLAIDAASSEAPTVGVLVSNLKIERQRGDYPVIDVRCAKAVAITNVYAYVGSSQREMVRHGSSCAGWNRISNASLFCGGSAEDYQLVHSRGSLQLSNISFEGSPAVAHMQVAAAATATHQAVNIAANSSSPLTAP